MKKWIAPVLSTLLLMAIVAVVMVSLGRRQGNVAILTGNSERVPVPMVPGRFQDTQCAMTIDNVDEAAQAVDPAGRTWFFDDVGCLALWLDKNRGRDQMLLWVRARDTGQWMDARQAWYCRDAETVMEYGFAPFAARGDGFVDFETMTGMMLRGENLTNPYVRKELLGRD